jgi:hypothetical protein
MEPQPTKLRPIDLMSFVVYVDTLQDPVIQKLKEKGLLQLTYVQQVNLLAKIPDWLTKGLPVLVQTDTKKGFRGQALLDFLSTYNVPVTLKHSVFEHSKRKKLWNADTETSEEVPQANRIPQYHIRG